MYDLGQVVPLAITVTDSTGALADGGTVTLTITLPDATSVTPTVTRDSLGKYHVDYAAPLVGHYDAVWLITGANASSIVDVFDVQPAPGRYIISLAEARAALNFQPGSTANDDELRGYIAAATPVIEDLTSGGVILKRSFTEVFNGSDCNDNSIQLHYRPVISVDTVVETGNSLVVGTDVRLDSDPDSGLLYRISSDIDYWGRWWWPGQQNITVTYTAGYSVVPPNVTLATRELIRHWWQIGQQGSRTTFGTPQDLTYSPSGFAVPNRVVELMGRLAYSNGFA